MNKTRNRAIAEKGDAILEFAAALPLFILILGLTGIFAWAAWAQGASAMITAEAVREAGMNRNGEVYPEVGGEIFSTGIYSLLGSKTGSLIGFPAITANPTQHQVTLDLTNTGDVMFGILGLTFEWAGGGSARMQNFYPGPPDTWE